MSLGTVTIEMKSLDRLLKNFPKKAKKTIDLSLNQSGLEVRNQAKKNAPVLTGHLRRSIIHKLKSGVHVEVGTDVVYARVREFNTKRLPKGYLRPALKTKQKKVKQIFERNINKVIRGK